MVTEKRCGPGAQERAAMTQVEAADFVTLLRTSFSALEVRPWHRGNLWSSGALCLSADW